MSQNIITRDLTGQEIASMRKKHLILIPVVLICAAVLYAVSIFDSLPTAARIAGGAIAALATLIFSLKHVKLEKELKIGKVQVITGNVTNKKTLGGSRQRHSNGIRRSNGSSGSQKSYFLHIDDKSFSVTPKIYSKVEIGNHVEMVYFEGSQFIVGIEVL